MSRYTLLFIASFLHITALKAQINHVKLGIEHGLPSKSVYGICEDKQRRVWIGTDNGLTYFQDGVIKAFKNDSLPRLLLRVYAAADSGIYVVGNNPTGIFKVYKSGGFKKLSPPSIRNFWGHLTTYSALEDAVYFSNYKYLFKCTSHDCDTICRTIGKGLNSIEIGSNGELLVNYANGLFTVTKNNELQQIHNRKSQTSVKGVNNDYVSFADDSITIVEPHKPTVSTTWGNSKNHYLKHAILGKEEYWFTGVKSGLFRLKNNQIDDFSARLNMLETEFSYVFMDSKFNLWCSTNGAGIVVLPYYNYLHNINNFNGLSSRAVIGINVVNDSNTIVITKGNIYKVFGKETVTPVTTNEEKEPVRPSEIIAAAEIDSQLIFAGIGASIHRNKLRESAYGLVFSGSTILTTSKLIVCAGWGRFCVIPKMEFQSNITLDDYGYQVNSDKYKGRVTSIVPHQNGFLIASDGGIFSADIVKREVSPEAIAIPNMDSRFIGLVEDSRQSIWACTRTHVYSRRDNEWHPVIGYDTLGTGIFTDFTIDAFDRFWIGTEEGLLCINEKTSTIVSELNGLLGGKVTKLLYNKGDSSLWVGTANGLSVLDLRHTELGNKFSHKLKLLSLDVVKGEKHRVSNFTQLGANENSFTINGRLLNYFELAKPEFRYRLQETGAEWLYTHNTQFSFLALSPGAYTFQVQARSPGFSWGKLNELRFKILQPFWKQWEFYIIALVALIALVILLGYIRLRQLRQRDKEKRKLQTKMDELELQAISANMNPHFIFNSLNSIQHYLMPLKNRGAIEHIAELSKLIRLNMQALGKERVTLKGEVSRVELYVKLEQRRFEKPFNFKLDLNLENDAEQIWLPSMLIQPLIENAIWHGIMPKVGVGAVSLTIEQEQNRLRVLVTDNGIGLKAAAKNRVASHQSKAKHLTEERLKLLHGENHLKVWETFNDQGQSLGTCAELSIQVAISE